MKVVIASVPCFRPAGELEIDRQGHRRIITDFADSADGYLFGRGIADRADRGRALRCGRDLWRDAAFPGLSPIGDPAGLRFDLQRGANMAGIVRRQRDQPHSAAFAGSPIAGGGLCCGKEPHGKDGGYKCKADGPRLFRM